MWCGVYKIGERSQSSGEPDSRPVESSDEDLGVGVKGMGDVQVVGCKGLEKVTVGGLVLGRAARDGDVGAAGISLERGMRERARGGDEQERSCKVGDARGEESAIAC